jgi:eukaryotic-like serine/threonine-protein kinase
MGTEASPRADAERVGLRFGPYEMDLRSSELWKGGRRVRLQLQPFRVLALLASRPGELVSRDEIRQETWPHGTYVDFEPALNFCIRQIRAALQDQAATARYVETLPRRGYRFIAPVEPIRGSRLGEVGTEPPLDATPDGPYVSYESARPAAAWLSPVSRRTAGALALLAAAAAAGVTYMAVRPPPPATPVFHRITFRRGPIASARFAPEGQVVYSAAWEGGAVSPYVAHVTARDSRGLDIDARRILAVSRAGEVAFRNGQGVLCRAPLAGGPTKDVLEDVGAADWLADGTAFAVARRGKDDAIRIEFPIGTVVGSALAPSHLRLSPDGRRLAFLEHPVPGDDRGFVVVLDREGERRELTTDWGSIEGLAWSPRGDEVWFTAAREGTDSALHAVDMQGRVRKVLSGPGRLVIHDMAPDGRLLIERNTVREEIRFRGPQDPGERDLSWFDLSRAQDLSADGTQLLIGESGEGGGTDYAVFLRRTDGTVPVRLGAGQAMALSPDGAWALSIPLRERTRLDLLPTGAGEVRSIVEPGGRAYLWASWRPDGRAVVYTAADRGGPARVYVRDLAGGDPRPVTRPGVGLWMPGVSPDGRELVAYDGAWFLYPLEGGEPRPLSVPAGRRPFAWADASTLYVRSGEVPATVERLDVRTGRLSAWKDLAPADRAGVLGISAVRIAAGGASYAYSYQRKLSDLYVLDGLTK